MLDMLTIIIPTFNRNDLLVNCIERLIPQLHEGIKIIIVDNASDVSVQETLESKINELHKLKIQIIRNVVNIGGGSNLLRCLEICETRWMYCLGDDDLVTNDCIRTIENVITSNNDALYISFRRSHLLRPHTIRTDGLSEFIDKLDDWGSFLFMSSSVVNVEIMKPNIRWGYLYSYSWAPFQAILFKILNNGGVVVFAHEVICNEESRASETWVPFIVAAGKMILPELIDDFYQRRQLAFRIMQQPRLITLVYLARNSAKNSSELTYNRFVLDLYLRRCAVYLGTGLFIYQKILTSFVLNPILFPNFLFIYIQNIIFKLTGRKKLIDKRMSHDRA